MKNSINNNNRVELLLLLYSKGRKIRFLSKEGNHDQILEVLILTQLQIEAIGVSQLADTIYSKLSAVSEAVDELRKRGLIDKECCEDKRKQLVKLTPKGIEYLKGINAGMQKHCIGILSDLNDAEIEILLDKLKKI